MNETQVTKINELLDNASFLITHFKSLKDDVNATNQGFLVELNTKVDELKAQFREFLTTQTHLSKNEIAILVKNSLNELNTLSVDIKNELNKLILGINAGALAIKFSGTQRPQNIENAKKDDVYLDKTSGILYTCTSVSNYGQIWECLNDEDYVSDVDEYPAISSYGFGVALRHKSAKKLGLKPINSKALPNSLDYGNYIDKNNNIFVCVPKMYYKIDNGITIPELNYQPKVEVSYKPKDGFSPFLCFVKSDGSLVDELFIAKYAMSNSMGVNIYGGHGASIFGGVPVGTVTHNVPNYLRANAKEPLNNNSGLFDAVKTNGENYCVAHASVYFMLAIVGMAKAQHCYEFNKKACAFIDKAPFYPKGNYQNSLRCSFDSDVLYSNVNSYGYKAKSGAISGFAKTTHNGALCGIADLAGNMWEIGAGFMATTNGVFVLKGIDYLEKLNASNIYDESLYNKIDLTARNKNGNFFAGNGTMHIFTAKTDAESKNDYICDNLIQIKDEATSTTGTDVYAKNLINTYMANTHLPVYGGHWDELNSSAGVFARSYTMATASGVHIGCRMMLVPNK